MRNAIHSLYKKTAELVTAPLSKSQFDEKRVLTPDEFVAAGDYLVRACPTWAWEGGDAKKRRPYLPADRQYLVTRNVPCTKRATDMESYNPNSEYALGGDEDGWTATHSDPTAPSTSKNEDDVPMMDGEDEAALPASGAGGAQDDDDVPDMDGLEIADDEATLPSRPGGYLRAEEPEDTIVRTRTYDLYITYDQYYQVPRLWLVGFDESRHPLAPEQILQDVSEEHARKTITVETHPHLSVTAASIHPCRHAEVMKKLVDNLQEANREFLVIHYLVLFLKFIASVVPTIQYDYTMSVGGA